MLATLVDKSCNEPGWMYEVKWDGYRAIGYVNKGETEIRSRNNKSFIEKFYPVYEALKKSGLNSVVFIFLLAQNTAMKSRRSLEELWQN